MSWRRQPPVISPVTDRAILSGFAAALRLRPGAAKDVEAVLRDRYRALAALGTNSGTSALILALQNIVPPGGTVAYPGYACIDLTSAAVGAGVRVRLYDVDPQTLSPDLDSVRRVLERGVDAIVVAHLYGYPADVVAVSNLAAQYGVPVIEDAAQGAGAALRGQRLGTFGDVSILSFGRGKGITGGSGGALLVRSPALADWSVIARDSLGGPSRSGVELASVIAQRLLAHPNLYALPAALPALRLGEMVYLPPRPPRAMSATCAAILLHSLQQEEEEAAARRARGLALVERIGRHSLARPVRAVNGGEPGYLRLAILHSQPINPRVDLGVVRGYPMTLDEHAALSSRLLKGERAGSGSRLLRDRLLTIPTHRHFTLGDLSRFLENAASVPTADRLAVFS